MLSKWIACRFNSFERIEHKVLLDFNFLKYVITYNKKKRHLIVDNLTDISKEKVLVFKNQKDLNNWLKDFTHNKNILDKIK